MSCAHTVPVAEHACPEQEPHQLGLTHEGDALHGMMATLPWQNPAGLRCSSSAYRRSVRHLAQRMTARKRDLRRQHLAAAELIWPEGATKDYGEPCAAKGLR